MACGEVLDFRPGFQMTWEITESDAAFETMNRLAPGKAWVGAPVHLHPSATESYEVREGELEVLVGDEWRTLGPGEKVSVPPGTSHTLRGSGKRDVAFVDTHAPAMRFESFFREFHRLVSARTVKLPPRDPRSLVLLATLFSAFPEEQRVVKPPPAVFGALAVIGRRLGYKPPGR
jgi:mannose-6-phosphate isomerase-like protein (cupin superfamily)